jgi:hypothetical protein
VGLCRNRQDPNAVGRVGILMIVPHTFTLRDRCFNDVHHLNAARHEWLNRTESHGTRYITEG